MQVFLENIEFEQKNNKKMDPGYYGNGFYCTSYPHYAAHYINYEM